LAALVRTKHPTWNPEQVKADIMNTAEQDLFTGTSHSGDRYAPEREGAGRIDAKSALDNLVLAYVADDPGAVSASFGPVVAATNETLTKTIDVVNKGAGSATYNVSYSPITTVPGTTYSVSPSSITMPSGSGQTATLPLRGTGLSQGSGADSIQSIVAGFELQATSGALPNCNGTLTSGCIHASDELAADLKYVGTTSNAPELQ